MAEKSPRAFGFYLRQLRERRGLSLGQVSELTRNASERLDRGALSRFENGRQVPSLFKLGPLCRVYEVSADVLNERMELDREVDRSDAPDTSGKGYDELWRLGRELSLLRNRKYEAFACFRDALACADESQRAQAWLNLATIIRSLGKNRLALHELLELHRSGLAGRERQAVVMDRIANCHRCLREFDQAKSYADLAIAIALEVKDRRTLAFAYSSRANIETDRGNYPEAARYLGLAFRAYRSASEHASLLAPNPAFEVNTLLMIAECRIAMGQTAKAHRNARTAHEIGLRHDLPGGLIGCEIILGCVDEQLGNSGRALQRWERAVDLAREHGNLKAEFTAEFHRFRHLTATGRATLARAAQRRLERLAPGVPGHMKPLLEFRSLVRTHRKAELGNCG